MKWYLAISILSRTSLTKLLAELTGSNVATPEGQGPARLSDSHVPGIPMVWSHKNNAAPRAHQGLDLSLSPTQGLCSCDSPSPSDISSPTAEEHAIVVHILTPSVSPFTIAQFSTLPFSKTPKAMSFTPCFFPSALNLLQLSFHPHHPTEIYLAEKLSSPNSQYHLTFVLSQNFPPGLWSQIHWLSPPTPSCSSPPSFLACSALSIF